MLGELVRRRLPLKGRHLSDRCILEGGLIALVFVIECLLVMWVRDWGGAMGAVLFAHMALVGALVWLGAYGGLERHSQSALLTLAAWTAICGPFGVVLFGFVMLGRRDGEGRSAPDFPALFAGDPVDPIRERAARLVQAIEDDRLNLEETTRLVSFHDCIETGTQDQKLMVLRAMATDYGPDFAPILRAAIVSEDAAVRVMASTVLAKLKKVETDRISQLSAALAESPDDPEMMLDLAEARCDFAESGLLGQDLADEERERARALIGFNDVRSDLRDRRHALSLRFVPNAEHLPGRPGKAFGGAV